MCSLISCKYTLRTKKHIKQFMSLKAFCCWKNCTMDVFQTIIYVDTSQAELGLLVSEDEAPELYNLEEDDPVELGPFKGYGLGIRGQIAGIFRYPTVSYELLLLGIMLVTLQEQMGLCVVMESYTWQLFLCRLLNCSVCTDCHLL